MPKRLMGVSVRLHSLCDSFSSIGITTFLDYLMHELWCKRNWQKLNMGEIVTK